MAHPVVQFWKSYVATFSSHCVYKVGCPCPSALHNWGVKKVIYNHDIKNLHVIPSTVFHISNSGWQWCFTSMTCMSLNYARRSEYPQGTHTGTGQAVDVNPQPSYFEATVPNISKPRHLVTLHLLLCQIKTKAKREEEECHREGMKERKEADTRESREVLGACSGWWRWSDRPRWRWRWRDCWLCNLFTQ